MAERDLQRQILDWLKAEGIWRRRLPVQGVRGRKGERIKNPLKGMPDIMYSDPRNAGVMGFIELKDESDLTDDQREIIWELEQEGFEVLVVHSLEELIPFLKIKSFAV